MSLLEVEFSKLKHIHETTVAELKREKQSVKKLKQKLLVMNQSLEQAVGSHSSQNSFS